MSILQLLSALHGARFVHFDGPSRTLFSWDGRLTVSVWSCRPEADEAHLLAQHEITHPRYNVAQLWEAKRLIARYLDAHT
jgi:hypothetical protein